MDTTSTIITPTGKTGRALPEHDLPEHEDASVLLNAPIEQAFAHLDDFRKLSAHMVQRSGMMAGSRMTIETDAQDGRAVGSRVRMRGRIAGLDLTLTEVVTERELPFRKAWQTVDARLLVIGPYRLGFQLSREGERTRARIFIDYALPERGRWLGKLFAGSYARWCIRRMAGDAERHFNRRHA
jgi:polyketide cyclase/dehydrase/lipid transport protein